MLHSRDDKLFALILFYPAEEEIMAIPHGITISSVPGWNLKGAMNDNHFEIYFPFRTFFYSVILWLLFSADHVSSIACSRRMGLDLDGRRPTSDLWFVLSAMPTQSINSLDSVASTNNLRSWVGCGWKNVRSRHLWISLLCPKSVRFDRTSSNDPKAFPEINKSSSADCNIFGGAEHILICNSSFSDGQKKLRIGKNATIYYYAAFSNS